MALIVLVS